MIDTADMPVTARLDDFELLERWRGGDSRAGEALFERHYRSTMKFFRNKVPRDVEDLVQETFMRCVASQERFPVSVSFKAYMLGVANNVLRMYFRRKSRKEGRVDYGSVSVQELMPGMTSVIAKKREQKIVASALRRIPLESQVLLELFYWEQLSGREISAVLNMPEGTVRTRISRARSQLKAAIEQSGEPTVDVRSTIAGLETWAQELREQFEAPLGSNGG